MEITEILSHIFGQKFREINGFTKEITKESISRNSFLVIEDLSFFHTVRSLEITEIYSHFFSKNFVKVTGFQRNY